MHVQSSPERRPSTGMPEGRRWEGEDDGRARGRPGVVSRSGEIFASLAFVCNYQGVIGGRDQSRGWTTSS